MPARLILLVVFVAVLGSCGQPRPEPEAPPPVASVEQAPAAAASTPQQVRPAAGALPGTLPAPGAAPRFVGMWAVDQRLCVNPAWLFEANQVSTQGEVHCDFNRILPVPTGYSVQATCTAEGPPTPYEIEFSFAESARAMMIAGGPWAHANLIYCGPLTPN